MLRAAVIGVRHGHVSEFLRAVAAQPAVTLVGIAEDEPRLRAKVAQEHSVPVYASYEELLEKERPDVACVVTTNATKYQALVACLTRGIHAIADKPLLTSLDQLSKVSAAHAKGKAQLSMMLSSRYAAPHRALKQALEGGMLGEIVHIYAAGPHKLHPETRNPWELDARQNGGVLIDIGVHYVDVMRWYSGQEPIRVAAVQGTTRFREIPHFFDHAQALFQFSGGMKGLLTADWLTPDAAPYHGDYRVYVTGTKGTAEISVSGTRQAASPNRAGGVRVALVDKEPFDLDVPPLSHTPSSAFLEALVTGREPYVSGEEVLRTMHGLLHAQQAADTGDWVTVPPARLSE